MKLKKRHLKYLIILILLILMLFNLMKKNTDSTALKIANWNLQIFGDSKESNLTLMKTYSNIIKNYDITFIQEIRDKDQTAFSKLCSLLEDFKCKISSRAGRTSIKEQYGVIYKKNIQITEFIDYNPDELNRWERPPIEVTFKIKNYSIKIYNIHIDPDDVKNELGFIEDIMNENQKVILIGDLNADCNYYNPKKETHLDNYYWIIKDEQDTTATNSDCAYDRIIISKAVLAEYISHGILKENLDKSLSDHYLIWIELKIS